MPDVLAYIVPAFDIEINPCVSIGIYILYIPGCVLCLQSNQLLCLQKPL